MKFSQSIYIFTLLEIAALATAHLNTKLNHYEVIDRSDIKHRIRRRDVNGDESVDYIREVTLSVLGRTLELELVPKPELFSSGFEAVTVDSEGNEKKFDFDQSEFYHGYLKGEEGSSSVTAQINNDLLTAAIDTKNDTYHIEPASGHITGNVSNKMIAYRDSDVNWNLTFAGNHMQNEPFCGLNSADSETTTSEPGHGREARSARHPRSTPTIKLKCGLTLVADYLYFKNMGQSNKQKTTHSMVAVINRVDELFKNTDWSADKNDPYKNYGFVIKTIKVHETSSQNSDYNKHLANNNVWKIKDLLEEFSRVDWSSVCLAHLFTYQDFNDGVIGLAYVAYPHLDSRGGICSKVDRQRWHNTGLSSSVNWGNRLLTTEADIVTAHEFGHNFGSKHDVATDSTCSPKTGGKYIMYPASVSGREEHNDKFSPCSRKAVKEVLKNKAPVCFSVPEESTFCGNFRVEGDEMCDPGASGDGDACCTSKCELKGSATCSDSNFEQTCCSNCQPANNTKICAPAQPLLCRKVSHCTGSSPVCPKPKYADEGTVCIERGKCDGEGNCQPFCKTQNKDWAPCLCTNDEHACFVCCNKNNTCEVYRNGSNRIALDNGRLCYEGVCREKKCDKNAQDFITRLQDFLDTLSDPSKFGEFLKDNIVGTVIVFSLMAWIPLSIIVNRIDKRKDMHAQELASWQDMQNPELIRQNRRKDFDVVFKKDSVVLRDSRKVPKRPSGPNQAGFLL